MVGVFSAVGFQHIGTPLLRGLASRPLLVASLEDHVRKGALIALCGEPGMGKSDALEVARSVGKQYGAHALDISLEGLMPSTAIERMARNLRTLKRRLSRSEWAVVCVSGVPACDENCAYRIATIIKRYRDAGHCVVLAMRPEAIQLVEACADPYVLWSDELCVEAIDKLGVAANEEIRRLSAGVPILASALMAYEREGSWQISAGRDYHDTLCHLMELSLREGLMEEERQLRLAMILLGSGTFADLESVVGTLDHELMHDICRYAPLFGVDTAQGSFACAGLCRDEWFIACAHILRHPCGCKHSLTTKIAAFLMKESRFNRAASVLELCEYKEDATALALHYSLELVNIAQVDIVRKAYAAAVRFRCCTPQLRHACAVLLKLVNNDRLEDSDLQIDATQSIETEERNEILRISLLLAARLAWQGRAIKPTLEAAALSDPLARDLMLHLSATHALIEGRGHAAYHLLVSGSLLCSKESLVGRLLEVDLALAHVFMGLPCPAMPHEQPRGELGEACMLCYVPALRLLDDVWRRGSVTCALGDMDIRADQAGDELVRAHLLLAGALANARYGGLTYAAVRCDRVSALASRCGASYIADLAEIIRWAARINAGDMPSEEEFENQMSNHEGLRALTQVLAQVAAGAGDVAPHLRDAVLDRDVAWVASALLSGFTRLSAQLELVMPPAWLVIIESMHARTEEKLLQFPTENIKPEIQSIPQHSIYVRVLGDFEVYVDGVRLPSGAFDKRKAKSLVTYACATNKVVLHRGDVIDAIWPECDYQKGSQRIYAATNVINTAVHAVDPACNFFIARGKNHAMIINAECVRSDVGEFVELVGRIIDGEGSTNEILAMMRRVQSLYAGDLFLPIEDPGGALNRRRIELRSMYCDALVAAGDVAHKSGNHRLAVRLCEQALLADETREDANSLLTRALRACGRNREARERGAAFAARLRGPQE